MKVKMINKYWLIIYALILILLLPFSINLSKDSYDHTIDYLKSFNLLSTEIDKAMLEISNGNRADFDAISKPSFGLNQELEKFRLYHEKLKKRSLAITYNLLLNEFFIPTDGLFDLAKKRELALEDFTTYFAIMRNSESISAQLIAELNGIRRLDLEWQTSLNNIEVMLLRAEHLKVFGLKSDIFKEVDLLLDIGSKQQKEQLTLLSSHINNVFEYSPKVQAATRDELILSEKINSFIVNLEESVESQYQVIHNRTKAFSIVVSIMAILLLIYGVIQTRQAILLSNVINRQNQVLESTVEQRTHDLKKTLDDLENEMNGKELIIDKLKKKDIELKDRELYFRAITETAIDPIILVNSREEIQFYNNAALKIFDCESKDIDGKILSSLIHIKALKKNNDIDSRSDADVFKEVIAKRKDGSEVFLKLSKSSFKLNDGQQLTANILHDLSEFKKLENDLAHSQKMESVGQLAAGIAHEINTPAQFISDNLFFLSESIDDILKLIQNVYTSVKNSEDETLKSTVKSLFEESDFEYLSGETPSALKQSTEGISHISSIIRAMKDYSHPGESISPSDINQAINSIVTVSRGEWKFAAELETHLDETLPLVECVLGDINQVVLNMIVNAAHAISDRFSDSETKSGLITIETSLRSAEVQISIGDNGNGIPEAIKGKVFDPFFTTKGVGKGTGQGLSIARGLIVEKHNGRLEIDSEEGKGTTMHIILPIKQSNEESTVSNLEDNPTA